MRSAQVAHDKLATGTTSDSEKRFLTGKILSAQHFVRRTLPETRGRLQAIGDQDRTALDVVFPGEEAKETVPA